MYQETISSLVSKVKFKLVFLLRRDLGLQWETVSAGVSQREKFLWPGVGVVEIFRSALGDGFGVRSGERTVT